MDAASRERLLAGLIVLGLFLAGTFIGRNMFVQPMKSRLAALRAEEQMEQQKSETLSRVAELERRVAATRGALLQKRDLSGFIESINRMAEESGVSLASVTPFAVEDAGTGYSKVPIQIEIRCGYHHVGRFLSKIESSSTFIKVESLRIERRMEMGDATDDGLNVFMVLNAFSRAT